MKIKAFSLHPYEIPLTNGQLRQGTLINIIDQEGNSGWGEVWLSFQNGVLKPWMTPYCNLIKNNKRS